jgi:hypothetical protein
MRRLRGINNQTMTKTSYWHWVWRLVLTVLVIVAAYITGADKPKEPTKKARRLEDIKLSAELRRDQVFALWGSPEGPRGSGFAYMAYILEDGQELWLAFCREVPEVPDRLLSALLFSPTTGEHKALFPKPRRFNDIKLSTDLTEQQVLSVWGQPDRRPGSGHDYKAYTLEDGHELHLLYFHDGRLMGALLVSQTRDEHMWLFSAAKQ